MYTHGYVISSPGGRWPIQIPGYRGAGARTWWPLGAVNGKTEEARRLTETLQLRHLAAPRNTYPPVASSDADFLDSYWSECIRCGISEVHGFVCASNEPLMDLPSTWILSLRDSCELLGIDVAYPDGTYSFINSVYGATNPELSRFLRGTLNENGLLNSEEEAKEFKRLHEVANINGCLEDLEGAVTMRLWNDPNMGLLRCSLDVVRESGRN